MFFLWGLYRSTVLVERIVRGGEEVSEMEGKIEFEVIEIPRVLSCCGLLPHRVLPGRVN